MYKEKIRNLKREIILEIRKYLINRKIQSIGITSPFKIYFEQKIVDDYHHVPLVVEEVDLYGTVSTINYDGLSIEIQLEEMDVYDLAHLHDQVYNDRYRVIDYIQDTEVTDV